MRVLDLEHTPVYPKAKPAYGLRVSMQVILGTLFYVLRSLSLTQFYFPLFHY